MLNMTSGQYLTPNFLQHFDFEFIKDYDMLRLHIDFYGFMLGFKFDSMDLTGDKAQQSDS